MAKTSPELLADILGVLSQINSKIDRSFSTSDVSGKEKASKQTKTAFGGFNIKDFAQDKKTSQNIKDTAEAIKILSSALSPLSLGLIKFGLIPKAFKKSVIYFIHDLLDQTRFFGAKTLSSTKIAAESLITIANALPKLAKGVFTFGIVEKMGLVKATSAGIRSLMLSLASLGNPATLPFVLAGAAALAGLGVALNGIANVLKSLAIVILSFAGGIVIMVGALWLAKKAFNLKGPLEAMGVIVGSLFILASGMTLLGAMGPLIALGGLAIGEMGKGLLWAAGGLLALVGSFALVDKITGGPENTKAVLSNVVKALGLFGLVFAGLGIIGGLIKRGGIAAGEMGKGMLWVSGGLLALGGVFKLLDMMDVNLDEIIPSVSKNLAILGLVFAGLGLFSPLILLGVAPLIAISVTLGIFSLIALGVGVIINKIGGKEGIVTMSNNISELIGGVLGGVIKGVSTALLGEEGSSKGFFGKIGTVAKNVAILTGSIFLLMGVSQALILFAFAIKAFTTAGIIKTVTGYKKNGEPIYGDSINVVSAGENIAKSIGAFFTTLTKTFEDPNIIPTAAKMAIISQLLLGVKGPKLLGIRLFSAEIPGILDAIEKFALVLTDFSKVNQIPIYHKDGKVKSFIGPTEIANNIVQSISTFFSAFTAKKDILSALSSDVTMSFAETLLGRESFRFLGLKTGRNRPGLLEPIKVFSDLIAEYAKYGEKNEVPIYNEQGKVIGTKKVADIAASMVTGISTFMTALSTALTGKNLNDDTLVDKLSTFSTVVASLSEAQTGMDKMADSMGKFAKSLGELSVNIKELNTEKLEKISNTLGEYQKKYGQYGVMNAQPALVTATTSAPGAAASTVQSTQQDWNKVGEIIAAKISEKLTGTGTSLPTGEFQFHFMDAEALKGNLTIKK